MKILPNTIKRWNFTRRLTEIETRISDIDNYNEAEIPWELNDRLKEVQQIVKYWKAHMKGTDDKPKKKHKKPVNVFD